MEVGGRECEGYVIHVRIWTVNAMFFLSVCRVMRYILSLREYRFNQTVDYRKTLLAAEMLILFTVTVLSRLITVLPIRVSYLQKLI